MGFWNDFKNTFDDFGKKSDKWIKENIDDKIQEKKKEYEKELVCKNCGAKLKNNVFKEKLVCEHCKTEQDNPKYIFVKQEQEEVEKDKED